MRGGCTHWNCPRVVVRQHCGASASCPGAGEVDGLELLRVPRQPCSVGCAEFWCLACCAGGRAHTFWSCDPYTVTVQTERQSRKLRLFLKRCSKPCPDLISSLFGRDFQVAANAGYVRVDEPTEQAARTYDTAVRHEPPRGKALVADPTSNMSFAVVDRPKLVAAPTDLQSMVSRELTTGDPGGMPSS